MNPLLAMTEFDTWSGRMVRLLRRRYNDACINIVTYHSVGREKTVFTSGTDLRHDPEAFEQQIDYLAENYNPMHLRELVHALESGETTRRAVVITFDDGYADALRKAFPILYRRRVPATIFPVTSVIGNADLLWMHKLAWLTANGFVARLDDALKAEGFPARGEHESVERFVRRCYRPDLPSILESVLQSTGVRGADLARRYRLYLEPAEISGADRDLLEFGNHTHTHPVLSALSFDGQCAEMRKAREVLKELTRCEPVAVAYPFGLKRDHNADSQRAARATGHHGALDMQRRLNVGPIDPFRLSRKASPVGSQEAFERLIEDWPVNARLPATGGLL